MSELETCRQEIEDHRTKIAGALCHICDLLSERGANHDRSKLEEPQLSAFAAMPRTTSRALYGSQEYLDRLEQLRSALRHHYSIERHHPQHHANGVSGMTLIDLVEMFVDWQVTWTDHGSGTFEAVLEQNQTRFQVSGQLTQIFKNTATELALMEGTT